VSESLQHPYLASYHDPLEEPDCPAIFDKWREVEAFQTIEELKGAITKEIEEYRAEVRAPVEWEDEDEEEEDHQESGLMPGSAGKNGSSGTEYFTYSPRPYDTIPGVSPNTKISDLPLPLATLTRQKSRSQERDREPSIQRQRETTPLTPFTALSEESFSASQPATRPLSRRQSGHSGSYNPSLSMSRRPTSFLFSGAMMALSTISKDGKNDGNGNVDGVSGGAAAVGGNTWSGRRSRAEGSLGPLIRQLSTLGVGGEGGEGGGGVGAGAAGDAPMSVSPSDAPPSAVSGLRAKGSCC
jgi:hypothetical protein